MNGPHAFVRPVHFFRPLDNWKRAEVAKFGWKQAGAAEKAFEKTLLPKRRAARIPTEKFTEYALNPQKAPDKAVAFSSALGYDVGSVDDLIGRIREGLGRFPATQKGDNGYGMRYEVRMEIEGRNSRTAKIITAWIDDNKTKEMRLVSAYVDKKKGIEK